MAYYYIADCHFGHANVLRFDQRPFTDVQEMEETMVANWNAVVKKSDTVFILGDFCWRKADEWLRIVKRLTGQKVLIRGNHDLTSFPAELKNQFADICDYKEIVDNGHENLGRKVILSHYPIPFFKHSNISRYYMLCGHVHNTGENDLLEQWTAQLKQASAAEGAHVSHQGQIYNVGCMLPWMNYTPRTLNQIIQFKENL